MANSDHRSPALGNSKFGLRIRRLGSTLACLAIVVGFLLLPPAWVPLGIIAWLAGLTVAARHPRVVGGSAVILFLLFLAKQTDTPTSAWFVEFSLVGVGCLAIAAARWKQLGVWVPAALAGAWVSAGWLLYEFHFRADHAVFDPILNRDRQTVVCVGDSLTAFGYPQVLSTMIDLPVVDHSEDGITTVDGVRKLNDILAAQPKVVVIELGGHDYLKGRPRAEIKERLSQIVRQSQADGAAVILFEIPCGLVTDPTRGVFREVAREHGARLIPDTAIRKLVFCSPHFPPCRWGWLPQLSDDGIHPNAAGNRALATAVRDAIHELNLPGDVVRR